MPRLAAMSNFKNQIYEHVHIRESHFSMGSRLDFRDSGLNGLGALLLQAEQEILPHMHHLVAK